MASSVPNGRLAVRRNREDVAWFISPHGLGHAARSAAVMEAMSSLRPQLHHHLFTTVGGRFFAESLPAGSWTRHDCVSDVGMVQRCVLSEDVEATVRALDRLELDGPEVDRWAAEVQATRSRLIVCDIAPLGLAVAAKLELPAVLVENFTWDWIYRAYDDERLAVHGARMAGLFASAALRIRTEPWCGSAPDALRVGPVSRRTRRPRREIRRRLGVGPGLRLLLLSVSGMGPKALDDLGFEPPRRTALALPTRDGPVVSSSGRRWSCDPCFHPDLVAASDAVIGKLGYSTVAEISQARTRFAFVRRPFFPESPILERWVAERIPAVALPPDWDTDPQTTDVLEALMAATPAVGRTGGDGAATAARAILGLLDRPA